MIPNPMREDKIDCLIVGGGPAGLTAALYMARYRHRVVLSDAGASRAKLISHLHHLAGFPDRVSGLEIWPACAMHHRSLYR